MFHTYSLSTHPQNGGVEIKSADLTGTTDPRTVAEFRCKCKKGWVGEMHGMHAMVLATSWSARLFWLCVIVAASVCSIVTANYILREYLNETTSTLITIRPVRQLVYPTFVFCPKYADGLNYTVVLNDLYERVGDLPLNTSWDLVQYVVAGTGFGNVEINSFDLTYRDELDSLYQTWRGNRTVLELFRFIFDENGIACNQLFYHCESGSQLVDCCKIFEPTYVMTRGRCFRLISPYYQKDVDETDKLSLSFNKPHERPWREEDSVAQMVMYMGDEHPEVSVFPRYYLNPSNWNRGRLVQRRISMLPETNKCSIEREDQGKSSCFVRSWLSNDVVGVLNCSLPYFHDMLPYMREVPICEPRIVVEHYDRIMSNRLQNKCKAACIRVVNQLRLKSTIDSYPSSKLLFRPSISFNNLEYEQYDEIRSTSLAGFISELGGQSGLFLGCTIMTIVQLVQSLVLTSYGWLDGVYRRYIALPITIRSC